MRRTYYQAAAEAASAEAAEHRQALVAIKAKFEDQTAVRSLVFLVIHRRLFVRSFMQTLLCCMCICRVGWLVGSGAD